VDYGEYAHRLGVQIVDREIAEKMAARFGALWRKFARKFRGVPIYVGHPDDQEFRGQVGHCDTRAYGWVQQLDARDNGLWIRVRWSPKGIELLEGAHYKFLSPRWEMEVCDGNRLKPRALLSVGLTNCPNLSVEAIANGADAVAAESQPCRQLGRCAVGGGLGKISCEERCVLRFVGGEAVNGDVVKMRQAFSENLSERMAMRRRAGCGIGRQLLTMVNERMALTKESYADAWRGVKDSHPTLFDERQNP
jgi:hypothetical protein